MVVLSAWSLVHDQVRVGMSGITGVDWAGVAAALKPAGYWDDERDCIPEDLFDGLRVMFRELVASNSEHGDSKPPDQGGGYLKGY